MALALATHLQAVAAFLEQIHMTPSFLQVSALQAQHLCEQLQGMSLSVEDAGKILQAIRQGPWPAASLEALTSAVARQTCVGLGPSYLTSSNSSG